MFTNLQIDNCNSDHFQGTDELRFKRWTNALAQVEKETGVKMYYSFVEWQSFDAWKWGKNVAHAWRSTFINA